MVEAKNDGVTTPTNATSTSRSDESGRAAHRETVERILDAAKERDIEAEARDAISVERDHAADLKAFTSGEGSSGYGGDLPARRHAALDRRDAKGDRTSAANDRAALTEVADDLDGSENDGLEEHGGEEQA